MQKPHYALVSGGNVLVWLFFHYNRCTNQL